MENVNEKSKAIRAEQLMRVADILKAISHPVRLSILEMLGEKGAMSVSDIQEGTGIEQSLLSHHLIKMTDKGELTCQRDGKNRFYELTDPHIIKIFECMESCQLIM